MNPTEDPVPVEPGGWSTNNNDNLFLELDFGDFGDNRLPGQLLWNFPSNFAASSPLDDLRSRTGHANRAGSICSALQHQLSSADGHCRSDYFKSGAQPVDGG